MINRYKIKDSNLKEISLIKVKDLSSKEISLLNEMKKNCLEGGLYKDEKAEEKFNMLCHLEDYCIAYYDLLEEMQRLEVEFKEVSEMHKTMALYSLQSEEKQDRAINYIDQVIMYKPCAREIDEELNTLIGIIRGE